jgi:hypothetical protein
VWEYDRVIIEFKIIQKLIDELNVLGANGWEIIYYQEQKPKKFGEKYKSIIIVKKLKTNMT